jgi:hypothetical protein
MVGHHLSQSLGFCLYRNHVKIQQLADFAFGEVHRPEVQENQQLLGSAWVALPEGAFLEVTDGRAGRASEHISGVDLGKLHRHHLIPLVKAGVSVFLLGQEL